MFGFLGFILFFILLIFLIGLSLIGGLLRALFGLGKRAPHKRSYAYTSPDDEYTSTSSASSTTSASSSKKKIFADDEGEYVEFEEVK